MLEVGNQHFEQRLVYDSGSERVARLRGRANTAWGEECEVSNRFIFWPIQWLF